MTLPFQPLEGIDISTARCGLLSSYPDFGKLCCEMLGQRGIIECERLSTTEFPFGCQCCGWIMPVVLPMCEQLDFQLAM